MEETDMTVHGAFHWNELMTRDVEKSKEFYKKTLGWTYEDMPMGPGMTYTMIKSNGALVGGMFPINAPEFEGMPESWFAYIAVDDLDKRLKLLKEAGGTVHREPFEVPGTGRIAIVADAAGVGQGWMAPAEGVG
jgi:predicted enzyme related to lactoylglutathione lyase